MQCPKCKSLESRSIDTRRGKTLISRVRYCENCEYIWSTKETIDESFTHKGFQKRALENNIDPDLFNNENE